MVECSKARKNAQNLLLVFVVLYCTGFLPLPVCSKANKHAQNLLPVSVVFISHSLEEVSVCSKAKVVTGVSSVYIAQVSCGCPCVARETSMHRTCCWFQ